MTRRLKYMLFADPNYVPDPDKLVMSGLFSWPMAFRTWGAKGDLLTTSDPDVLDSYDIVAINYTPGHSEYVSDIRDKLNDIKRHLGSSSTLLISNVDYSIGMWLNIEPLTMKHAMDQCDFVFNVESMGAARLSRFLERDVSCIPHPVDVMRIKQYKKYLGSEGPFINIGNFYHRYLYSWDCFYYMMYNIRKDNPMIKTHLFNFSNYPKNHPSLESKFSQIHPTTDYIEYIQQLVPMYIMCDLQPDFTYGRSIVESAALGIPCITSETIEAGKNLFPDLQVMPHDSISAANILDMLLRNPEMTEEYAMNGRRLSEMYSYHDSYERMVAALEERNLV